MGTVRGLAGTALSHYDRLDDDERRELLGLIEQESRRLLATVTQASTALKVDAGTVTYDIRPQGLGATIREGIASADVGQHPLELDVAEEEVAARPEVDHRGRSPAGRQRGEVLAAGRADPRERRVEDGGATIEVIDEGPGIPVEHRDDVFDKYPNWRPDGYEQEAGSGLGLFLVRGIVLGHLGEVHIVDGPRSGYDAPDQDPFGGPVADDGSRPVTLLICDDHKVLTDALAIVVGLDGRDRAGRAARPGSAIGDRSVCRAPTDVVLMDIDLKGSAMTGIEATRGSRRARRPRRSSS